MPRLEKDQIRKGTFITGGHCPGEFVSKRAPLPRELEEFESAAAMADALEAADNLAGIREALAHNANTEVHEMPGLNHLFQTATTGSVAEYGSIEETLAPAALKLVSTWIAARGR